MNVNQINKFSIICFISLIVLFALVNAWLGFPFWKTIEGSYSALGGHIPYSDANSYYNSTFLNTLNNIIDPFNTRRPIHSLYLSFLQRISNFNFPLTILLQSCLLTAACSLFAFGVAKKRGLNAALISVLPIILLAMVFLPTTMSENSGLILGVLAASVIYYAWHEEHIWFYRIGLCMFSVALSARSGCYFVLISLLLLTLFYPFKGCNYKNTLWNMVFIALGLSFVAALSKLFGSPAGGYQANFSYTLYGLVTGGTRWNFVLLDPRVAHLLSDNEVERAHIIYEHCWLRFKENPFLLILGLIKSAGGFVRFLMIGLWRESWDTINYIYSLTHFIVISTISWRFYRNRHLYMRDFIFIAFVFTGIFLSSAFIWADAGYRVFCTVPAFYGLFFALGIFPKSYLAKQSQNINNQLYCLGSIFLFLCITIVSVISFLKPLQLTPPQEWATSSNEEGVYIVCNLKNQPSFIVVEHPKIISMPAQMTKETFLHSIEQNKESIKPLLTKIVSEMKQFYIVSTYDFIRKKTYMFILENEPLASNAQWFKLKAAKNADGLLIARIEESK
jgi:hypothetical protein